MSIRASTTASHRRVGVTLTRAAVASLLATFAWFPIAAYAQENRGSSVQLPPLGTAMASLSAEQRSASALISDPVESALRLEQLVVADIESGHAASADASLRLAWARAARIPDSAIRDLAMRHLASLASKLSEEALLAAQARVLRIVDARVRADALHELAQSRILAGAAGQRVRDAFLTAHSIEAKDDRLLNLARLQLLAGMPDRATVAAMAVGRNVSARDRLLAQIVDRAILWGRDPDAITAHKAILSPGEASRVSRNLVSYALRGGQVSVARETAAAIESREPRLLSLLEVSEALIRQQYFAQAEELVEQVTLELERHPDDEIRRPLEVQRFALLLAGRREDAALELWYREAPGNLSVRARLGELAEVLARARRIDELTELANSVQSPAEREIVEVQTALAVMRADGFEALQQYLENLPQQARAAAILLVVADEAAWKGTEASMALRSRLLIDAERLVSQANPASEKDQNLLVALAETYVSMQMPEQAIDTANQLPINRKALPDVQRILAIAEAVSGRAAEALDRASEITSSGTRIETIRNIAGVLMRMGMFRHATDLARGIPIWTERVKAFNEVARSHVAATGVHRFSTAEEARASHTRRISPNSPPTTSAGEPRVATLFSRENLHLVSLPERKAAWRRPLIPDLDGADPRAIRAQVPPIDPGRMHVTFLHYSKYNEKFMEEVGKIELVQRAQSERYPRYLFLETGVFDLPAISRQLEELGEDGVLLRDGRVYTLRMPLLIGPDATLVITGNDVDALRLSKEAVSYLVSAGKLYVVDTQLVSWSETENEIATLEYLQRREFRPFFLAWSGSGTWVAQSRVAALGYQSGKAYGMSFSTGPTKLLRSFGSVLPPPTGIITESSFEDMLYGYYSYEAEDMKVVGNTYTNNIVYGVDPHDRSKRLIFAYNTVYGTQVKHGLISSREVDETWWLGNVSFQNAGSGLMLDRDSETSFILANLLFDNDQDGLTFFESSCSLAMANRVAGNRRNGVLLRNSWYVSLLENEVTANAGNAIIAYTSILNDPNRDLTLDPYSPVTSFTMKGNLLSGQRELVNLKSTTSVVLGRNRLSGDRLIGGIPRDLGRDVIGWAGHDVAVVDKCGLPPPKTSCPLVEQGFISAEPMPPSASGDGSQCPSVAESKPLGWNSAYFRGSAQ